MFFVISVASCSWNLNDHLYIFYAWGPIQLLQNIEIKIPLTFPYDIQTKGFYCTYTVQRSSSCHLPSNSKYSTPAHIIEEPIMATNQASRILPKLIVAATATGGTLFACHHLESQRRILDDKSDGCTSSTISGALTSLQSKPVSCFFVL